MQSKLPKRGPVRHPVLQAIAPVLFLYSQAGFPFEFRDVTELIL